MMEETPEGRKPLGDILRAMKPVDFVLLEGFKDDGDFPRIEVSRGPHKEAPLWTKRGDIVAVASDTPEGIPPGMPWLNLNEPRQVADFIVSLRDSWMKEKDNVKE